MPCIQPVTEHASLNQLHNSSFRAVGRTDSAIRLVGLSLCIQSGCQLCGHRVCEQQRVTMTPVLKIGDDSTLSRLSIREPYNSKQDNCTYCQLLGRMKA